MLLVDADHLTCRARFAKGLVDLATQDGRQSGVIFGFLRSLDYVISKLRHRPEEVVCVWGAGIAESRRNLWPEYKQRPAETKPDDVSNFSEQLRALRAALSSLGIRVVRVHGCEADDLIAILAHRFAAAQRVWIFSADKDFHTILSSSIRQFTVVFGKKDEDLGPAEVVKQWKVDSVAQILPTRAIIGDRSDNIPGVAGAGKVYAPQCVRFWNEDLDRMPKPVAKLVKQIRNGDAEIVFRNINLMRLPKTWGDTEYTQQQRDELEEQVERIPRESFLDFAKLCYRWDLHDLSRNLHW